ncbi:MAG: AbrB/MazE/SpoVT family DNA-binding domain-containing protein [Armatimonadetes bacterium]|nr:AbrB/MazE/SpoVT family DNA-binding domain-containing protein [Armatimonadota bacterium]
MKTTIDKAGRVVIPAEVRNRLRLRAGTELEVLVEDLSVRLVPMVSGPRLVKVGNRWVARPAVPWENVPPFDIAALVEEERDRWPI